MYSLPLDHRGRQLNCYACKVNLPRACRGIKTLKLTPLPFNVEINNTNTAAALHLCNEFLSDIVYHRQCKYNHDGESSVTGNCVLLHHCNLSRHSTVEDLTKIIHKHTECSGLLCRCELSHLMSNLISEESGNPKVMELTLDMLYDSLPTRQPSRMLALSGTGTGNTGRDIDNYSTRNTLRNAIDDGRLNRRAISERKLSRQEAAMKPYEVQQYSSHFNRNPYIFRQSTAAASPAGNHSNNIPMGLGSRGIETDSDVRDIPLEIQTQRIIDALQFPFTSSFAAISNPLPEHLFYGTRTFRVGSGTGSSTLPTVPVQSAAVAHPTEPIGSAGSGDAQLIQSPRPTLKKQVSFIDVEDSGSDSGGSGSSSGSGYATAKSNITRGFLSDTESSTSGYTTAKSTITRNYPDDTCRVHRRSIHNQHNIKDSNYYPRSFLKAMSYIKTQESLFTQCRSVADREEWPSSEEDSPSSERFYTPMHSLNQSRCVSDCSDCEDFDPSLWARQYAQRVAGSVPSTDRHSMPSDGVGCSCGDPSSCICRFTSRTYDSDELSVLLAELKRCCRQYNVSENIMRTLQNKLIAACHGLPCDVCSELSVCNYKSSRNKKTRKSLRKSIQCVDDNECSTVVIKTETETSVYEEEEPRATRYRRQNHLRSNKLKSDLPSSSSTKHKKSSKTYKQREKSETAKPVRESPTRRRQMERRQLLNDEYSCINKQSDKQNDIDTIDSYNQESHSEHVDLHRRRSSVPPSPPQPRGDVESQNRMLEMTQMRARLRDAIEEIAKGAEMVGSQGRCTPNGYRDARITFGGLHEQEGTSSTSSSTQPLPNDSFECFMQKIDGGLENQLNRAQGKTSKIMYESSRVIRDMEGRRYIPEEIPRDSRNHKHLQISIPPPNPTGQSSVPVSLLGIAPALPPPNSGPSSLSETHVYMNCRSTTVSSSRPLPPLPHSESHFDSNNISANVNDLPKSSSLNKKLTPTKRMLNSMASVVTKSRKRLAGVFRRSSCVTTSEDDDNSSDASHKARVSDLIKRLGKTPAKRPTRLGTGVAESPRSSSSPHVSSSSTEFRPTRSQQYNSETEVHQSGSRFQVDKGPLARSDRAQPQSSSTGSSVDRAGRISGITSSSGFVSATGGPSGRGDPDNLKNKITEKIVDKQIWQSLKDMPRSVPETATCGLTIPPSEIDNHHYAECIDVNVYEASVEEQGLLYLRPNDLFPTGSPRNPEPLIVPPNDNDRQRSELSAPPPLTQIQSKPDQRSSRSPDIAPDKPPIRPSRRSRSQRSNSAQGNVAAQTPSKMNTFPNKKHVSFSSSCADVEQSRIEGFPKGDDNVVKDDEVLGAVGGSLAASFTPTLSSTPHHAPPFSRVFRQPEAPSDSIGSYNVMLHDNSRSLTPSSSSNQPSSSTGNSSDVFKIGTVPFQCSSESVHPLTSQSTQCNSTSPDSSDTRAACAATQTDTADKGNSPCKPHSTGVTNQSEGVVRPKVGAKRFLGGITISPIKLKQVANHMKGPLRGRQRNSPGSSNRFPSAAYPTRPLSFTKKRERPSDETHVGCMEVDEPVGPISSRQQLETDVSQSSVPVSEPVPVPTVAVVPSAPPLERRSSASQTDEPYSPFPDVDWFMYFKSKDDVGPCLRASRSPRLGEREPRLTLTDAAIASWETSAITQNISDNNNVLNPDERIIIQREIPVVTRTGSLKHVRASNITTAMKSKQTAATGVNKASGMDILCREVETETNPTRREILRHTESFGSRMPWGNTNAIGGNFSVKPASHSYTPGFNVTRDDSFLEVTSVDSVQVDAGQTVGELVAVFDGVPPARGQGDVNEGFRLSDIAESVSKVDVGAAEGLEDDNLERQIYPSLDTEAAGSKELSARDDSLTNEEE